MESPHNCPQRLGWKTAGIATSHGAVEKQLLHGNRSAGEISLTDAGGHICTGEHCRCAWNTQLEFKSSCVDVSASLTDAYTWKAQLHSEAICDQHVGEKPFR